MLESLSNLENNLSTKLKRQLRFTTDLTLADQRLYKRDLVACKFSSSTTKTSKQARQKIIIIKP